MSKLISIMQTAREQEVILWDHGTESIHRAFSLLAEPAGSVSATLNTNPARDFFPHPTSASNTINVAISSISMTTEH